MNSKGVATLDLLSASETASWVAASATSSTKGFCSLRGLGMVYVLDLHLYASLPFPTEAEGYYLFLSLYHNHAIIVIIPPRRGKTDNKETSAMNIAIAIIIRSRAGTRVTVLLFGMSYTSSIWSATAVAIFLHYYHDLSPYEYYH